MASDIEHLVLNEQRPFFTSSLEECGAWLESLMKPWLSVLGSLKTGNIHHNQNPKTVADVSLAAESSSCIWTLDLGPCRLLTVKSHLMIG